MPQQATRFSGEVTRRVQFDYLIHFPSGVEPDSPQAWPLILFLHGSGERGTDLNVIKLHGLPKRLDTDPDFPFIVVSPQCPANTTWSEHLHELNALLDDVIARYPVDARRIYLTGLSMGGGGTWHFAYRYPERFAAIVPICGSARWYAGDPEQVCALQHIPIWVFHGALDTTVPLIESARLVQPLLACGAKIRFTVYSDLDHNSWDRAYGEAALYEWLLEQSL